MGKLIDPRRYIVVADMDTPSTVSDPGGDYRTSFIAVGNSMYNYERDKNDYLMTKEEARAAVRGRQQFYPKTRYTILKVQEVS